MKTSVNFESRICDNRLSNNRAQWLTNLQDASLNELILGDPGAVSRGRAK